MKRFLYFIFTIFLIVGCRRESAPESVVDGDTLHVEYASLLTMQQCDGYVYVQIRNPWDSTRFLHSYVLVDKDAPLPQQLPEGDVVRTPLSNAAVSTSVPCSLIEQLGAYDAIKGVCDLQYLYLDRIKQDCRAGRIADLGSSMAPDVEGIIQMSPDAILMSPFETSGAYGKIGKLGVPVIECADYMEVSPLGRAEWMRFYGMLFGRAEQADSLFAETAQRYNSLKALAAKQTSRPTVFMDMKTGNQWLVPGGNSTVGIMLRDAGADYIFKEKKESGSVAMSPEEVFDRCVDGQFWLVKYNQAVDKSYAELSAEYSNYTRLSAFVNRNVYGCNLSKVAYYEETPFHPDLLLKDYIRIFHPECLPNHKTRYFSRL